MAFASDTTTACCSRCGAGGHKANACPKPFFRPMCRGCGRLGHEEPRCPEKRRTEAAARKEERAAGKEAWQARKAAWEARHAAWEARQAARGVRVGSKDIDDAQSDSAASMSTKATAEAESSLPPMLSVPKEKEARKLEKKLREVAQLEERMSRGESLDALQRSKVERRAEFEGELVMHSMSTKATAEAESSLPPMLSVPEEKEARKFEKKLREVAQLEERMSRGESLDALQRSKVERRAEFEGELVMQKVRQGYRRRADVLVGC